MGGEFVLSRRFGYKDGIMGGNLWFMGEDQNTRSTLLCKLPKPLTPRKAWSRLSQRCQRVPVKLVASIHSFRKYIRKVLPYTKRKLGEKSGVPVGVNSIMEIIINGRDLETVAKATYNAFDATNTLPGLKLITAGNYGGRLGKSFIYLRPELNQAADAA